jgi:cellulose synthase/poly-beta-1,6-N-acetylglucosamine synthase-like glycosyltransferase
MIFNIIYFFLYTLLAMLILYFIRHFTFTLNRAYRSQGSLYVGIEDAVLPTVTILVPAHNEEKVIGDALTALLAQDYPPSLFHIMPLNDRSTDGTRAIIDRFALMNPGRIRPYHRDSGKAGKSAALKEVCGTLDSEIIIIFDADYIPAPKLLRNLVSPFIDPEVGAVMGRVVPINAGKNLLTRVLDLERSAGYQVDQQARMNMHLLPQYGGTVGGVRRTALLEIGGFDDDILAEDTDITFKLFLSDWVVIYQNSCECYEEVPEHWDVRIKQISRWAKGHNQVLFKEFRTLLRNKKLTFFEKADAILLLGIFFMGPVMFLAWGLAQVVYYAGHTEQSLIAVSFITYLVFSSFGNFALFFEIGTAAFLDGFHRRIRLLPLGVGFFFVSLTTVSKTFFKQIWDDKIRKREITWDKTTRYREKT